MHPNPPDRLNLRVWLMLAIVGMFLGIVGWCRYFKFVSAVAAVSVAAQHHPSTPPAFAEASITFNKSGDASRGGTRLEPGGRFTATNVTLRQLIQSAYQGHGFERHEVSGGPPWMDSDRFDVAAKAAGEHSLEPDGFPRQTWLMLRTLLADRFKLRAHTETARRPIYALEIASSDGTPGPQLRKSDIDCAAVLRTFITKGERPPRPSCSFGPYPRRLTASAVTMRDLASYLSGVVDRIVVDRTGLTGNFDLEVEGVEIRAPGPLGQSARPSDTNESIFTTLPRQLGLKLEPLEGPVEIIVVDHAEKLAES